ncbi:MAG: MBL fold metallo-hydrolase [Okeania sp. SIO2D1]|nr:MBL fold metallo-hydrolase [Okeania sp. SIO2D1]
MSWSYPTSSDVEDYLACLPYGVGHFSEGMCLFIKMGAHRILLDCGLSDISPLIDNSSTPDAVICSHAHADHARGLFDFHRFSPQVPIYASEVTTQLLPLNWPELSIEESSSFYFPVPWRQPLELAEDLVVQFFPAGHLPGAAIIALTYTTSRRTYTLVYTGDFFLSNSQLVEGLSIESLKHLSPDVLIIEGSYGTARYPHRRQQEKKLMSQINQALAEQKNVLMPVPILGLGQEILKLLRSHHQFTGRDLDIWVDPNVASGCDTYLQLLPEFPIAVQNFAKHQPLFWDERVCPRMRRLDAQTRFDGEHLPCIVLTDCNLDWQRYCRYEPNDWLILLPSPTNLHFDENLLIPELSLESYHLSEHCDRQGTTQLIHNLRPQHVIFVHGSPNYLADLTSLEELQNRYHLHYPAAGKLVELPIGDTFIQPEVPPETKYQGELNELASEVNITLGNSIKRDSRWNNFGDTGLVEARWQGEELIIRAITQRELLAQSNDARLLTNTDCCRNCCHQRGQRCWNGASPLYGFKVTPEGYCPVFEPVKELPKTVEE